MRRLELTCGVLVGLLILAGCTPARRTRAPTPAPTATAVPTATPVPTPPGLTTFLAPPPQECPASPPPDTLGPGLFGRSPVFTTLPLGAVWHLEQGATTPDPDPGGKILWEVGPNYAQPVKVVVANLGTGSGGWWGQHATPKVQYLLLDPTGTDPDLANYTGRRGGLRRQGRRGRCRGGASTARTS